MAELPDYKVGDKGVNIVASPLHTPDGGLLSAQNCEFIRDAGIGGLGMRGGLAKLNTSALAGAVVALENLPFGYPTDQVLMVALNAGETPTWKKSSDGASFTNLTSANLERTVAVAKFTVAVSAGLIATNFYMGQRSASYKRKFYYAGDNYIVDSGLGTVSKPDFVVFDGVTSFELFRVPVNPSSVLGTLPYCIPDVWMANGLMYLAVFDPGGVAPNHKGRVLVFDPEQGNLYLVGNRFGNGSGENAGGFPNCLTSYLGRLWAGTNGISGNQTGKIYSILPGIEETWTLDHSSALHSGYYMSLAVYKGKLYAATSSDVAGQPRIEARTSTGTWSDSLLGPNAGVLGYFGGLIVFNDELYACYYEAGVTCLVKKFDGTTWVTAKDIGVDYAIRAPGNPFVFRGELYWPFFADGSDTNLTGFLTKRTTAGVWSRPLTATGMRGALGQYFPDAS